MTIKSERKVTNSLKKGIRKTLNKKTEIHWIAYISNEWQ